MIARGFTLGAIGLLGLAASQAAAAPAATVIELTQTGCQFLESENGVDHGFMPRLPADCNEINASTGDGRLAEHNVLKLAPGDYVFRVTNTDVPYELGFFLREPDYDWRNPVHQATKTAVSGGGLVQGKTQDYAVTLEPGEYIYSCPLNPTPNYKIVVSQN